MRKVLLTDVLDSEAHPLHAGGRDAKGVGWATTTTWEVRLAHKGYQNGEFVYHWVGFLGVGLMKKLRIIHPGRTLECKQNPRDLMQRVRMR